jgi:hypothetical protein
MSLYRTTWSSSIDLDHDGYLTVNEITSGNASAPPPRGLERTVLRIGKAFIDVPISLLFSPSLVSLFLLNAWMLRIYLYFCLPVVGLKVCHAFWHVLRYNRFPNTLVPGKRSHNIDETNEHLSSTIRKQLDCAKALCIGSPRRPQKRGTSLKPLGDVLGPNTLVLWTKYHHIGDTNQDLFKVIRDKVDSVGGSIYIDSTATYSARRGDGSLKFPGRWNLIAVGQGKHSENLQEYVALLVETQGVRSERVVIARIPKSVWDTKWSSSETKWVFLH